MRVLAIDPGYERVGIAVIERDTEGKDALCYSDCFRTSADSEFPKRLSLIGDEVVRVIEKYAPKAMALETLFFNSNQKTAMRVAEVRGALLSLAAGRGLALFEYTPLQVKTAMTGYGRADKRQVTEMVKRLISVPSRKMLDDEYDAIAIGLTCLASSRQGVEDTRAGSCRR